MKVSCYKWRLVVLLLSSFTSVIGLPMVVFAREAHAEAQGPILPCSAKEIKATVSWDAAMRTQLGDISYTNISSHICSLYGYPIIQLKDESGFVYHGNVQNTPNIYYYGKTLTNVVLRPHMRATSSFAWRGCVAEPKGSILVFVTLPHETAELIAQISDDYGNSNVTKHEDTPTCPENVTPPSNKSSLEVGSFQPFQEQ